MTTDTSSVSLNQIKSMSKETMHINWQFDEARKIWLLKYLNVDPHRLTMHTLQTQEVTFAYDIGYRQALLVMRLELKNSLTRIQQLETEKINSNETVISNKSSVCDEIKELIKSIDEKIEVSYQYDYYENTVIEKSKIEQYQKDTHSLWWAMK